MKGDTLLGIALGVAISVLSVAGNVRRADAHLVSTFPDVVTMAVMPAAVYVFCRRKVAARIEPRAIVSSGRQLAAVGGAVFAVSLALFTWWWLPLGSMRLALFALVSAFAFTFGSGYLTARLVGLRVRRRGMVG